METTEFKVGDVVRIKRCWLNGVNEGLELEVIRIGGACVFTKPHPQIVDDEPAFVPHDIELVRRAPASPAQEASAKWVEVDRNETHVLWQKGDKCHAPAEIGAKPTLDWAECYSLGTFQLGKRGFRWLKDCPTTGTTGNAHGYIPRDPMPSGSAGKEEWVPEAHDKIRNKRLGSVAIVTALQPGRVFYQWLDGAHGDMTVGYCREYYEPTHSERPDAVSGSSAAREAGSRVAPSGGDSGRYNGNDLVRERTMAALTDIVVGRTRVEAARKRNIAALARELDQPSAERRSRLHPHEGRSDRVYLANRRNEP